MCYDGTYSQACCEGLLLNLPPPAPAAAAPAPGAMGPAPAYGWSTPWPSTYGPGGIIAADDTVPVAAATYGGGVGGPHAVALAAMMEGDVSTKLSVVRQANGYASVAESYALSQVGGVGELGRGCGGWFRAPVVSSKLRWTAGTFIRRRRAVQSLSPHVLILRPALTCTNSVPVLYGRRWTAVRWARSSSCWSPTVATFSASSKTARHPTAYRIRPYSMGLAGYSGLGQSVNRLGLLQ